MTGVGEFLKNHREQKGIRLEEIASITKIHIQHLKLIEQESWKELPPEPFLRGFLIAYAKYVGADPRETLSKFYEQKGITPVEPEKVNPIAPAHAPGSHAAVNPSRLIEQAEPFPAGKILMGVGMVLLVILVGTLITIGKKATTPPEPAAEIAAVAPVIEPPKVEAAPLVLLPNQVAEKPSTTLANPTAEMAAAPSVKAEDKPLAVVEAPAKTIAAAVVPAKPDVAATPPAAEKTKPLEEKKLANEAGTKTQETPATASEATSEFKHELVVDTQKKTWYKIIIDGAAPVQAISKENDKLTFRSKEKIKLVLGNSSGATVHHNGTLEEGTKFSGTIRYFKYPIHAKFPQDIVTRRNVTSNGEPTAAKETKEAKSSGQKTIGDWLDSPRPDSQTQ